MKKIMLGSSALLLVLGAGSPAFAQSGNQDGDANYVSEKIETITVTAQRHEEAAQDVGIALSVLT